MATARKRHVVSFWAANLRRDVQGRWDACDGKGIGRPCNSYRFWHYMFPVLHIADTPDANLLLPPLHSAKRRLYAQETSARALRPIPQNS